MARQARYDPRVWPQIRAGLVALAIAFGLIDGLPLPPGDDTPAWEQGFVESLRHVQRIALWPVRRVGPTLRIVQRWALYQAPGTDRWRMWIEGRAPSGRWMIVYRAGDPEHSEDEALIENGHVRGVWDITGKPPVELSAFADWITARVLARHPEYTGARMRMEKIALTPDGMSPLGQFAYIHIRDRGGPP
jgi:hypothetical protein